jgi:hypothetical protein
MKILDVKSFGRNSAGRQTASVFIMPRVWFWAKVLGQFPAYVQYELLAAKWCVGEESGRAVEEVDSRITTQLYQAVHEHDQSHALPSPAASLAITAKSNMWAVKLNMEHMQNIGMWNLDGLTVTTVIGLGLDYVDNKYSKLPTATPPGDE